MSEQLSGQRAPSPSSAADEPAGGWAAGFAIFAGVMMTITGTFQAIEGLAAILNDEFYVVAPHYVYSFDVTAWGWVHLLLGVLVAVAGFFVFSGRIWARAVGVAFAVLNAITQFLFLPYYPIWGVLMIALDIAVIWALCLYGSRAARLGEY